MIYLFVFFLSRYDCIRLDERNSFCMTIFIFMSQFVCKWDIMILWQWVFNSTSTTSLIKWQTHQFRNETKKNVLKSSWNDKHHKSLCRSRGREKKGISAMLSKSMCVIHVVMTDKSLQKMRISAKFLWRLEILIFRW